MTMPAQQPALDLSEEEASNLLASGVSAPVVDPPATQDPPAPVEGTPTPTPDPEGAPTPDPEAEPPTAAEMPSYLADLAEEDRPKVLNDWLSSVSPEERAQLPAVNEMLQSAADTAALQAEERLRQEQDEAARQERLEDAISSFTENMTSIEFSAETELQHVAEVAQENYHEVINEQTQGAIFTAFKHLGFDLEKQQLPDEFIQRINNAKSWGEQMAHYLLFAGSIGQTRGSSASAAKAEQRTEAEEAVYRSRVKNEALADLAKGGRIRIGQDAEGIFAEFVEETPPRVSGNESSAPGRLVALDENPSEDQLWDAAAANLQRMKAIGA